MKSKLLVITAVVVTALLSMAANTGKDAKVAKGSAASPELIKRGGYLVMVGGCNDCHTPMKMTPMGPAPDHSRFLSGRAEGSPEPAGNLGPKDMALTGTDLTSWKQPFGTVYARNLTPDKTGLGTWTEEQFIKTMRLGRHQGDGRPLLPPMPWFNFAGMTDGDLKAMFAYLRSIKPIKNTVPDPKVPPPVFEQFEKTNAAIVEMLKKGPPH